MNEEAMFNLIERIKTEPSVLFLGQDYLSSLTGNDIFYDAINESVCGGAAPASPCYENLWKYANGNQELTTDKFKAFYDTVQQLPEQKWLRTILSMRWGIIYTSAVDSCLSHCVGPNFTFNTLGPDKSCFRKEYISKNSLHGIYLYGAVDGSDGVWPPKSCDKSFLRRLRKNVNDRINWIYNDIIRDYGVLVIDGWHPEKDWASKLLDNATDLHPGSIYLFGADQYIKENETVSELVEDKIIHLVPSSFATMLEECGYMDENEYDFVPSAEISKTITICNSNDRSKKNILNIPCSALEALDKTVTVIHDDLGYENLYFDYADISERFARYLLQEDTPIWSLCTIENNFHFKRKIDECLYKDVTSMMKKVGGSRSNILILEGVSNSGKTAALIHLAMVLRQNHIGPVIYISGQPIQADFAEYLKRFIKHYLLVVNNNNDSNLKDRVVIIWDGNLSEDASNQYKNLSNYLAECNVLIVGSIYKHEGNKHRNKDVKYVRSVSATLDESEIAALNLLLKSVDEDLLANFQKELSTVKNPNIIFILQKLAKFQHCQEWKEVASVLTSHFYKEVDYSERKIQKQIKEHDSSSLIDQVYENIVKYGIAASWQLQLQKYKDKFLKSDVKDKDDAIDEITDGNVYTNDKQIQRLLRIQKDVQYLNEILAVAGQFSICLPVTLIFRMLHEQKEFNSEYEFLNDLLASDILIEYHSDEQGYPYVRFRHPLEAELYIRKNFGENDSVRRREVNILCSIIKACRWDTTYDTKEVVELIRCFGPNSRGKYSQHVEKGNYFDYIKYLPDIANELHHDALSNPEAVLIYAHFLREKAVYDRNINNNNSQWENELEHAKNALNDAIQNHDRHNIFQFNRLKVELCSNFVASMPRRRSDGSFSMDVFQEFHKEFHITIHSCIENRNPNFSTNYLLDIWLNAMSNFFYSFSCCEDALKSEEFVIALADSLSYIDRLFEIDINFESLNLLTKIDLIYQLVSDDIYTSAVFSKKFSDQNNDTLLYLTARRYWTQHNTNTNTFGSLGGSEVDLVKVVRNNLFFLPDDADSHDELLNELPELHSLAIKAAKNAISFLEQNMAFIISSKSCRCLEMLIRAKWLVYTGRMPLEEKQCPSLSNQQWKDLSRLCDFYENFCSIKKVNMSVYVKLFQAIYLCSYTNNRTKVIELFSYLRQKIGYGWFIERIGLCVPGTEKMRTFHVDVRKKANGDFCAEICKEIIDNEEKKKPDNVIGSYKIHIPKRTLNYLFDANMPRVTYNIQKKVVIWFNAAGAVLDIPPK